MKKMDIILHPVRFRIIQRFLDGKDRTAKRLAKELKDIPQATLYRQLDTLVKAGILFIAEENQIRGTVEKVYTLHFPSVNLQNEDITDLSKEEHLQYFLFFTAQLTRSFEAYLEMDDINFERDGVGYRQITLNLSDTELIEFVTEMRKVYKKYLIKQPSPNRTKRTISTILIPEKGGGIENE